MDEWKAADPAIRPAIQKRIAERAQQLQEEALAVQAEVVTIEEGAEAWPDPDAREPGAPKDQEPW